jgi:hypothetical protein
MTTLFYIFLEILLSILIVGLFLKILSQAEVVSSILNKENMIKNLNESTYYDDFVSLMYSFT